MSDYYYIPFEIQSEVMKRLPVKSIVQFRSVSKQWKACIDNPEFIKNYHIEHPNPKHHLIVQSVINNVWTYTSIIDDNTFPQQKFPLTPPEPLNSLRDKRMLGSVDGLLCFYGFYQDDERLKTNMVVIWNPSLRKCVGIPIPNILESPYGYNRIGFGVCPETNDPKLVKINALNYPSSYWEVQVLSISSRVWKTVYTGAPFKSCHLFKGHIFIGGIIYWQSHSSFLISFDLKSEKFGEVWLPERLGRNYDLCLAKVNGSLGLLEYYKEVEIWICGVWMRKDGVSKPFTNIYTVNVEGKSVYDTILGLRKNGEVVMQMEDDDLERSHIVVYEPSSGRINSVGISGERCTFSACSYLETLLLLDQSNAIIH